MAIRLPGAPRSTSARPIPLGRVAIIGTASNTLQYAPWDDPSWTFWAHASAVNKIPAGRADLLIDTHPPHCFMESRKNGFRDYYDWLKRQTTPIVMQQVYPEIPASRRFPIEKIKQLYPYKFGSQAAMLVALALYYGVKDIGFWGVEYAGAEYVTQRAMTTFWVGLAIGQGVKITLAPGCELLTSPGGDYAYETHSTPEKYEELKKLFAEQHKRPAFAPGGLKPLVTPDDFAEAARTRAEKDPVWAKEAARMAHETIPQDILDQEAREAADVRDDLVAELTGATP